MLDDKKFVQESLNTNLFYLRAVREYCLNIQLSFYVNNNNYSQRAETIALRCEDLGRLLVEYTQGVVPPEAIKYQTYVTDYTLEAEELTEKLFNVKIATDITREELQFEAGTPQNPSPTLVKEIESVNQQAIEICDDFIALAEEIRQKLLTNELFSYTYPALYVFMINTTDLYQQNLKRLNNRTTSEPIYATSGEYLYNLSMYNIVQFLRGLIDPAATNHVEQLDSLLARFAPLLQDYQSLPLTPENQKQLTSQSIPLVAELRKLLQTMLMEILSAKLYFIVEATMIDNFYTDVNYFAYILDETAKIQEQF